MTIPHLRFVAFLAVLGIATASATHRWPVEEALLLGFDIAAAVFIALAVPPSFQKILFAAKEPLRAWPAALATLGLAGGIWRKITK